MSVERRQRRSSALAAAEKRASAATVRPLFGSTAAAVASARQLIPTLRARASEADARRSIPVESIRDISERGLFGLVAPRRWGGSELGLDTLIEVSAALAEGCGSTAWVYVVLAAHQWVNSLFPEEAQAAVLGDPNLLTASVVSMAGGPPVSVSGGYLWKDGEGQFCSGVDHASWLLLGAYALEEDGTRERRFFLVPANEVEIADDWQTVGLRGTGSKSIRLRESFIPMHQTLRFQDVVEGCGPGAGLNTSPLYRLPFDVFFPLPLVGPEIGIGRVAIEAFTHKLATGDAQGSPDFALKLTRLARASAQVDAAMALCLAESRQALGAVSAGITLSHLDLARCRRNVAFAAQLCRAAVNSMFEGSGGAAIYDSAHLQRLWCDSNAAAAHRAFAWDIHAPAYGRAALLANSPEE